VVLPDCSSFGEEVHEKARMEMIVNRTTNLELNFTID